MPVFVSNRGLLSVRKCVPFFFFGNKGVFPKIWGHPAHTAEALLTQHFFPSDELNLRAKQIKNVHSFNCFIQPASPWIIYVAPPPMIRLHSLLSFTPSLASGMLSPLSLKQPFTPSIHLLLGLPLLLLLLLLLDISFLLTSLPPFFQHVQTTAGLLLPPFHSSFFEAHIFS